MDSEKQSVLDYWNDPSVESMYDKHLLSAEIRLIRDRIAPGSKVLDAGCGEGETTHAYSTVAGVSICGADFSETRLAKAEERLSGVRNVTLKQVDFLGGIALDKDFDAIISQRFVINIMDWGEQIRIIRRLMGHLRQGGRLLLLEGYQEGVEQLNSLRASMGLEPIPVRWHNRFLEESKLLPAMEAAGHALIEEDGLGEYFVLTRGVRPAIDATNLDWNCEFNRRAALPGVRERLQLGSRCSRLKLWVFQK